MVPIGELDAEKRQALYHVVFAGCHPKAETRSSVDSQTRTQGFVDTPWLYVKPGISPFSQRFGHVMCRHSSQHQKVALHVDITQRTRLREPNVIGPAHTWSQPIRHVIVHGTPGSFFLAFDSLHVVHQYSREKDERGTV